MILEQTEVFHGRVIRVTTERVRLPNEHVADLEIVHHPGGAAVVAVDAERRVCLLRQFRHAANGYIWELPAGKLEPAEPPAETAKRELAEEAGFSAASWTALGRYVSSPGVFTEVVHLFMARDLTPGRAALEESEVLQVHWIPFEEALNRAANGEIEDGKSALGLWRASHWLNRDPRFV